MKTISHIRRISHQANVFCLFMIAMAIMLVGTTGAENPKGPDKAQIALWQSLPPLPVVAAGPTITTYTGIMTRFDITLVSLGQAACEYTWDYDGDGQVDWRSSSPQVSFYQYDRPGTYTAVLAVTDDAGRYEPAMVTIEASAGMGEQGVRWISPFKSRVQSAQREKTITKTKFGIILCTAGNDLSNNNEFYHDNVIPWYYFLVDSCQVEDTNVYVLVFPDTVTGRDTAFERHIDFSTPSQYYLDSAFNLISQKFSASQDELYLIFTGHGNGLPENSLVPENVKYHPDDWDKDFTEDSIPFVYNYNYYHQGISNALFTCQSPKGLGQWTGYYVPDDPTYYDWGYMRRWKLVSHFQNVKYYDSTGAVQTKSDNDVYLEKITYLPLADTNQNGRTALVEDHDPDWDGDSIPPMTFDSATCGFTYDEGDWDTIAWKIEEIKTNYWFGDSGAVVFDYGLNDTADVDINFDSRGLLTPSYLHINGSDSDNDGKFIQMDFNEDGDKVDTIGRDESVGDTDDDFVAMWLDSLEASFVWVGMMNCFSGGFINDLSRPGLVISTPTTEFRYSYGELFLADLYRPFTDTLARDSADTDSNGCVSFVEAFNFAAQRSALTIEQYDDDGDHVGHAATIPSGGDGDYGATQGFLGLCIDPDTTGYVWGDANADSTVSSGDAIHIIYYLFSGGDAPDPLNAGDPNSSCDINVGDAVFIINYIFKGGEAPDHGCVE